MSSIELGNILGVRVDAVDMQLVLDSINGWIDEPTYENVCVVPAHTVMDCRADPQLRRIVNASGLATPDGMSIVWLLKLQGFRDVERVYGPDLMQAACRFGLERGWRHFFYGGAGGVAAELVGRLTAEYSGLQVAGTYTPPFRQLTEEDDRHIVRAINDSGADIVWVGIGSPRQEYWMAEHLGRLQAPVMVGVGAAFDFLSGM
jgi:N-acetylglucosaminyldiphosphoundecaprenol N-acetyl-beta-D-mannosaminyltransferase